MTKSRCLIGILWGASFGLCGACAGNAESQVATPAAGGPRIDVRPVVRKYVALGSSFAAGPKIPDAVPNQSCGRSTGNYAHLVAADLGLELTEASCIGATIDNIATTPQAMNPVQIASVTPDTAIITITIGGNDVSYSASLTTCGLDGMKGTSCLQASAGAAGPDVDSGAIDDRLDQEAGQLVAMLDQLKQAAPAARIYLVAYPMILPEPAAACPPEVPMQDADAAFLGKVGTKLQAAFSLAAAMAGATFVDLYGASHGRDACAPADQRWVEGQSDPAVAAYHPNAAGMRAAADLIVAAIQREGARP